MATGAGLHTAAYYVEEQSTLGSTGTVLSVAIPVGIYIGLVYLLYGLMVRTWDVLHLVLVVLTVGTLGGRGGGGVGRCPPMTACLLIVTLAPLISVVGFEVIGHRHMSAALAKDA